MVEAIPNCIRIAFVVANVWLWSVAAAVGNAGPKTCDRYFSSCFYDKLNFSADGLQRLRASATIMQDSFIVQVMKLITPYPDGVLLLLFDEYVNNVEYWKYHDQFFRIPAGCKLSYISIRNAPQLQKVAVAAPNDQLQILTVFGTGMVTLPDSFLNLLGIRTLSVQQGVLRTICLDPLANSSNLTVLMLGYNHVKQLVVSNNRDLVLPVKDLSLADNLLDYIDGAFFNPLKHLVNLYLQGNRLQRIDGPIVSFPRLTICYFNGNQMTYLNVSNWRAPQLEELYMSLNNLTQLPVGLEKLPNLTIINLSYNKLSTIDLRRLEGYPKLQTIDVSGNLLQTVRVSHQGQVTLRLLEMVNLAQNQISQIDFTRWNMPMLRSLRLAFNRRAPQLEELYMSLNNLTQLPVGLEKLPNLTIINLSYNKLSTIDLRRLEGYPKLQTIDVSGNLLQTVRVSHQGQVTLRLLEMVNLAQNQISQIDFTRWNMPMLRSLRLAFNRLESLPDLFKLFPKLQESVAYGNPLRCNSLRQLQSYLADNKLTVDTTAYGQPCVTNSSFKVSTGAVICCMG